MQKRFYHKFVTASVSIGISLSIRANCLDTEISNLLDKASSYYEKLSPSSLLNLLLSGIPSAFSSLSVCLGLSLCLITIYHLFCIFKDNLLGENIFDTTSSIMLVLVCSYPITLCLSKTQEHLSALCGYMLSFIPTSAALHAASGNTVSATVNTSSTSIAIALIQFVSISVVLPIIKAIFAIICINSIVKRVNLSSVSNTLKSLCLWTVGLSFTFFTGLISISSALSSSADNLAMKGFKYAAGRLIPIAGSMISESMRTVTASTSFIKSVTGVGGIVFIIYSIIPPICILLSAKLYFFILSCYSGITGNNSMSDFLSSVSGIINILLALFIGCAVSFIIMLFIFIKTTVNL